MEKERERAVALGYNPDHDSAPVVVASGQGYLAEKIKEIARASGVPLKKDSELAEYLMALDLYQEIPPELYPVVAEILAFIYNMNSHYPEGDKG
ncbi:EscU/YscU/HrcU family type III secretion system export apparatus switch protein [Syntrophomonas erecta]